MVPNLQKVFVQTICKKTITMLKIESCELSFEKISKFSFTENFWSETKIRKTPHCVPTTVEKYCNAIMLKFFREINSLVTSLAEMVEMLIWRKNGDRVEDVKIWFHEKCAYPYSLS